MSDPLRLFSLLSLLLCGGVLAGCGAHNQEASTKHHHTGERHYRKLLAQSAALGLSAERQGIISPDDYARWQQTGSRVSAQGGMADSDLDWALALMQKPSAAPSDVNVMMMGLFLTARAFPPDQQQKIRAVITPLLSSRVRVERKCAKDVIKKLG